MIKVPQLQEHVDGLWDELGQMLQERQAEVKEEIQYYPPPIPACDVYFNHLLELRAKLPQIMREFAALRESSAPPRQQIKEMQAFVSQSGCFEVLAANALQKRLRETESMFAEKTPSF